MRTTRFVIVVTAIVGLSACRCNKSPGPQTTPSVQPASSALPSATPVSPSDAGAVDVDAGDAGANTADPAIRIKALDFAPVKGSKFKPMKLKEDGRIVRDDKVLAQIADGKLTDDDGSAIATFGSDGRIAIAGSDIHFKFNEKDELEGPTGLRVAIDDEGRPTIVPKANAAPEKLTGKFVDFDPTARRAGEVMLALRDLKKAAKAAKPKTPGDGKADKKAKKDKKGKKKKGKKS